MTECWQGLAMLKVCSFFLKKGYNFNLTEFNNYSQVFMVSTNPLQLYFETLPRLLEIGLNTLGQGVFTQTKQKPKVPFIQCHLMTSLNGLFIVTPNHNQPQAYKAHHAIGLCKHSSSDKNPCIDRLSNLLCFW